MKWIKYQIVQSEVDGEVILATKKVGYNETNLAIAITEAYKGEYTIEEGGEEIETKPLSIELGGTGAKTAKEAAANLGINGFNIQGTIENLTAEEDVPTYWLEKAEGLWYVENYTFKRYGKEAETVNGFIMNVKVITAEYEDYVDFYMHQMFMRVLSTNSNYNNISYRASNNSDSRWSADGWFVIMSDIIANPVKKGSYTGDGDREKTINTGNFINPNFVLIQGLGKQIIGFRGDSVSWCYVVDGGAIHQIPTTWNDGSVVLTAESDTIGDLFDRGGSKYYYIAM